MKIVLSEFAPLNPFGLNGLEKYGRKKSLGIPNYRYESTSSENCRSVTTSNEFREKSM